MRVVPDKLTELKLNGGTVWVDEYGYITDPDAWSREFAEHVAASERILLTPLHWEIIAFMRTYLEAHGITADVRFALKLLQSKFEISKPQSKQKMLELFPYGYVKQACKIAGMIQPRAWSTG